MWWRQRNYPRLSQLGKWLRWTIMPVGFIGFIKAFKNYKDEMIAKKKKRAEKKKGDNVVADPGVQETIISSGVDYKSLMEYANGKRCPYPPWWTCDRVLLPCNIETRAHWVLIVLDLRTWDVTAYDSFTKLNVKKEVLHIVEELGDSVISYLDAIGYWRHVDEKKHCGDTTEFMTHFMEEVPQQTGSLGDCGVWVCRNMEQLAYYEDYRVCGETDLIASEYRQRMIDTFFSARFDWEMAEKPAPPTS